MNGSCDCAFEPAASFSTRLLFRSATELPFVGLDHPYDVAVDGAGTVYVTDSGHNRVVALTAGSATPVHLPFADLSFPAGVTVDRDDSVYVTAPGGSFNTLALS